MFKKIVCPVGREEATFFAVPTAIEIARVHKAELILLHLDDAFLDKDERIMMRISVKDLKTDLAHRAVEDRRAIEEICERHGWLDSISDIVIREGSSGFHLSMIAEKLEADLLVIHTTGRQHVYERVVGSTADSIVHHASMPVLVLRRSN